MFPGQHRPVNPHFEAIEGGHIKIQKTPTTVPASLLLIYRLSCPTLLLEEENEELVLESLFFFFFFREKRKEDLE